VEQSELSVREFYEKHARSCDPKDFQSHVKRTLHGKPVEPDQVEMIADAIVKGLKLESPDVLLDLCCGNGAITNLILARCRGGVGVDFTPYLIEVAKNNFERPPHRLYRLSEVSEYVEETDDAERFTKVLCYGAFQYVLESKSVAVLLTLRRRFPNVRHVFLGNLPDLDRAAAFFRRDVWPLEDLRRHDTALGIWRTEEELTKLAATCGWHAAISRMPCSYYGAHYRFDAILTAA
jgi:SAM-dependent methyltransferase